MTPTPNRYEIEKALGISKIDDVKLIASYPPTTQVNEVGCMLSGLLNTFTRGHVFFPAINAPDWENPDSDSLRTLEEEVRNLLEEVKKDINPKPRIFECKIVSYKPKERTDSIQLLDISVIDGKDTSNIYFYKETPYGYENGKLGILLSDGSVKTPSKGIGQDFTVGGGKTVRIGAQANIKDEKQVWFPSGADSSHFYTTSADSAPYPELVLIGICGYVYPATSNHPNTFPLYHYYSKKLDDHFYTIDPANEDLGGGVWEPQGVIARVFLDEPDPDLQPFRRFLAKKMAGSRTQKVIHFYAVYPNEEELKAEGYSEESNSPECFIYPPGIANRPAGTVPLYVYSKSPPSIFGKVDAVETLKQPPINHYAQTVADKAGETDSLGFQTDANAFAKLIALKSTPLPLAIGIFGQWGSGKSTFMRQIKKGIESEIKNKERGDQYFYHNILQIEFNAWHYSDKNLWACLIYQIFKKLHEELKGHAKDADKKLLHEVKEKLKSEIKSLKQIKKEGSTSFQQWKEKGSVVARVLTGLPATFVQEENKEEFDFIKNDLLAPIEDIISKESMGKCALEFLKSDQPKEISNSVSRFFKSIKELGWWGIVAVLVFALGTYLPLSDLTVLISDQLGQLAAKAFGWIGVVGSISGTAYTILNRFNKYNKVWNVIKSSAQNVKTETDKKIDFYREELEKIDLQILEVKRKKNDLIDGKYLLSFIEERLQSGDYQQYLGLISLIREDLEKLEENLGLIHYPNGKKERSKDEEVNERIPRRIVLYIDDLDRCSNEVVIKVLEAVHLLLAFDLFVVIVGVDYRWMSHALSEHYPQLSGYQSNEFEEGFLQHYSATPADYLEKIFQIPYQIRPVQASNLEKLMTDYFPKKASAESETPTNANNKVQRESETTSSEDQEQQKGKNPKTTPEPEDKLNPTAESVKQEAIEITQAERDFIKGLGGLLASTPRTFKRFTNLYQVIKVNQGFKIELVKLDEAGRLKLLNQLAFVLALHNAPHLKVKQPNPSILAMISKKENKGKPLGDILKEWSKLHQKSEFLDMYIPTYAIVASWEESDIYRVLPFVKRFTFEFHE